MKEAFRGSLKVVTLIVLGYTLLYLYSIGINASYLN
ncbi:hypothetical protein Thu_264 [Bacillus phage Thurquoise]|uniref:Uncharacterized protein n=1 Tax=Bacillus phage Deep Blue TaxID=1792245 RepID=A0A140HLI3_9CAUD|nr:hypothetical protein Blue_022 [Bacillus phage Deep Blue]AMO25845.1 hypothetical protein Blue_022 [Bacillus phage Deep Blue]UXQ88880.1 hypothetical protein Thu_20 [Bacillus phage Thurquoise]UXQ89107.1 hypothetical protein Thu_264 [Bacillus phage Thurquoise]